MPHPTPHPNHFPKTNASQRQMKQDHSKHAKITRACLLKWQCSFSNHHKSLRLPRKMNMSSKENDKTAKKTHLSHIKKCEIPRACQRKCTWHFFHLHKTLRLPRKTDVLKVIRGRRLKCTFFNLKNWKKTHLACTRSKFRKGQMTMLATARHRVCG